MNARAPLHTKAPATGLTLHSRGHPHPENAGRCASPAPRSRRPGATPGLQAWPCTAVPGSRRSPAPCSGCAFPPIPREDRRHYNHRPRRGSSPPRGLSAPRGGVLRAGLSDPRTDDQRPPSHSRRPAENASAAFRGTPHLQAPEWALPPGAAWRPGVATPHTGPGLRDTGAPNAPRDRGLTCRPGSGTPTLGAPQAPPPPPTG